MRRTTRLSTSLQQCRGIRIYQDVRRASNQQPEDDCRSSPTASDMVSEADNLESKRLSLRSIKAPGLNQRYQTLRPPFIAKPQTQAHTATRKPQALIKTQNHQNPVQRQPMPNPEFPKSGFCWTDSGFSWIARLGCSWRVLFWSSIEKP